MTNYMLNNKKKSLIICSIILIILFSLFIYCLKNSHRNTTGSKLYTGNKVVYNCDYYGSNSMYSHYNIKIDFLINYNNYSIAEFKRYEYTLKNIDNNLFKKILDDLGLTSSLKYNEDMLNDSSLELSTTKYGFDTLVKRTNSKVVVTANSLYGLNKVGSKDEVITYAKNMYQNHGFKCK